MENKIQIKNRYGKLLFECDKNKHNINQLAYAIGRAFKEGANLRNADLRDADLRDADLRGAKNAPLIINGLSWQVIIDGLGGMQIGCQQHEVEEWKSFTDGEISEFDEYALEFWSAHKAMLLSLCDSYKHPAE